MKHVSALQYGWKFNLKTTYSYIYAYKSWKSVMIIMFRTSTEYIKLVESNIYNILTSWICHKIRGLDSFWTCVLKV